MSLSSTYPRSISCRISQISEDQIMRKLHNFRKGGNFGYFRSNFWANKNFPKRACCQLEVLINQQLHAKYEKNLMKQSWENYISMENEANLGICGPLYEQTRIFPN